MRSCSTYYSVSISHDVDIVHPGLLSQVFRVLRLTCPFSPSLHHASHPVWASYPTEAQTASSLIAVSKRKTSHNWRPPPRKGPPHPSALTCAYLPSCPLTPLHALERMRGRDHEICAPSWAAGSMRLDTLTSNAVEGGLYQVPSGALVYRLFHLLQGC